MENSNVVSNKMEEKSEFSNLSENISEIDNNSISNLKLISPENKKYLINNYMDKIKYIISSNSKPNYYEILNVNINSDYKTIRRSYLYLSKLLEVNKKLPSEYEECYSLIQKSYRILTDKFERFYYDALNNYINDIEIENQRKILEKEGDLIYANKIEELKEIYNKKLNEENLKNGLIIEKALFGNLTLKKKCINNCLNIQPITEEHIKGPFLDYTIILQSKVENSSLLFNDDYSFAYFCDIPKPLIKIPSKKMKKKKKKQENDVDNYETNKSYADILEDTEMYLYIKYKFLNIYHELIVVDRSNFTIPQSSHRIFGNLISGPFSPVNIIKMKHISNSYTDHIFHFFAKNKLYITLFTTIMLCVQSMKSMCA
ncbi:DnaJ protein, putative [Plasmodium yoelii]|uniref:J domain-containing protein n=2 Tax=Plasmodium yoelii TaxID=5861 RepID=Q7RGX3_PLAYO|nr:DnaJ protein, putative [Plasmodium yoelii]EAA16053.1 hypothetical protein [Plasmodium yoelii yoelii]CDU18901.1 DnaJ protein, putative [Plasmodium yoelii]VTZ79486.1 DnaJ protein, putative [Plasmodium yoelii]|eukprot:XP_724488.1 DnaJ protein, putative [Plasmodium yoelii]